MPKIAIGSRSGLIRNLPLLAAALTPILGAAVILIYIAIAGENFDLAKLPATFRDLVTLVGGVSS